MSATEDDAAQSVLKKHFSSKFQSIYSGMPQVMIGEMLTSRKIKIHQLNEKVRLQQQLQESYIMSEHSLGDSDRMFLKQLRLKVQSPAQKPQSPRPTRTEAGALHSPRSRNNGLLRDKLQVIKKHTLQMALEHPQEVNVMVEELRGLMSELGQSQAPETEKRQTKSRLASRGIQTDEPYLPLFCQEISVIKDKPCVTQAQKTTAEYLRAREAIYQEIYADNEALVRQNLRLAEENSDLNEVVENLTAKLNEASRKYAQLQKTVEKLHEVGSVHNSNSKVLQEGGSEEAEAGRFVFSPRSSNLSSRKSCLSLFKNTACSSNFFDQTSNLDWRAKQRESPSPRITIQKEYAQQTAIEGINSPIGEKRSEIAFYQKTLSRLAEENASRSLLIQKLRDVVWNYLQTDPGELTIENIDEVIEKVYKKRSSRMPIVRRNTMNLQTKDQPDELKYCKSETKLTTIHQQLQKKFIRRKC